MFATNPFDLMHLYGPWRCDPFTRVRRQAHFQTLCHWYEIARFDEQVVPDVVEAARLMPSTKTVRRFASRHQTKWKADWQLIRPRVLMQGLFMLYLQNRDDPVWNLPAQDVTHLLHEHGIHDRFATTVVEHFLAIRNAPRILVVGAATAPPKEVGKKINALHKRLAGTWVLAFWMGKHVSWEVHDWADSQRLGILPIGEHGQRIATPSLEQMLERSDQALIFERRGGKTMDRLVRACKARGIATELALWTDEAMVELPETSAILVKAVQKNPARTRTTDDLFDGV